MSQRLTKERGNISPSLNPSHRSTERSSELTPKTHDEVKGGKVPSPLVGECLGEGYFRINIISIGKLWEYKDNEKCENRLLNLYRTTSRDILSLICDPTQNI